MVTASFGRTARRGGLIRLATLALALLGIVAVTVSSHAAASVLAPSQELAGVASLAVTATIATIAVGVAGEGPFQLFGRTRIVRRLGIASGLVALVLVAGSAAMDLSEGELRTLLLVPAALFEEVLFRGVPFMILNSGRKPGVSIIFLGVVLTSTVFALLHPSPHLSVFFDAFMFSLLAFGMLAATHSIWPSIAFRIVANVTAVTFPTALFGPEASISALILDAGLGVLILAILAFWLKRAMRKEAAQ